MEIRGGKGQCYGAFAWDQILVSAKVDAMTKVGVQQRCGPLTDYFGHLLLARSFVSGSVLTDASASM